MIKNQLQHRVAQTQARRFEEAIAVAAARAEPDGMHPIMWKAYCDGLESQLSTLRREISEYEALSSGAVDRIEVRSLEDLPSGLIKARIARGLTHKDLAERIGVKPQQIQRWENDDYETVGFNRLVKIADALEVEVCESISFRRGAPTVVSVLQSLGIDKAFVKKRLVPSAGNHDHDLVAAAAKLLERIWGLVVQPDGGLNTDGFFCGGANAARFKLPKNADPSRVRAYAQYAYFIAERVAHATTSAARPVSRDWRELRAQLCGNDSLDFRSCLERTWDLGIPVIPLSDPVRFHGVCWRFEHRNVIVLKQTVRTESRWLFDLVHELYHAGEPDHRSTFELLAAEGTDPERRESEEERAANDLAGDVLLNGEAAALYEKVLERSRKKVALIKRSVVDVARDAGCNVGILANYVAFRLKAEAYTDWWGAAANLQPESEDSFSMASAVFRERFNFSALSDEDRRIVELATSEPSL